MWEALVSETAYPTGGLNEQEDDALASVQPIPADVVLQLTYMHVLKTNLISSKYYRHHDDALG